MKKLSSLFLVLMGMYLLDHSMTIAMEHKTPTQMREELHAELRYLSHRLEILPLLT